MDERILLSTKDPTSLWSLKIKMLQAISPEEFSEWNYEQISTKLASAFTILKRGGWVLETRDHEVLFINTKWLKVLKLLGIIKNNDNNRA